MAINRIAASTMIREIPAELRNAARAERKVIINESKKDPISTSIKAAHGQFDFAKSIELKNKMEAIKNKLAVQAYEKASADTFIQRQPIGEISKNVAQNQEVYAGMYL